MARKKSISRGQERALAAVFTGVFTLLAGFIGIIFTILKWLAGHLLGQSQHIASVSHSPPVDTITGPGSFEFEVVGESNYQPALAVMAGPKDTESKRIEVDAVLMPEPDNTYDKNAVAVVIQSRIVAYLSKKDTSSYRRWMKLRGHDPQDCVIAKALIVGGWKNEKSGSEGTYGIKLDAPFKNKY